MASKSTERRRATEATHYRTSRPVQPAKPLVLLVCEGRNTEPSYFNQLQAQFSRVRLVAIGEGYNRESLIRRALTLRQEGNYAEVWCVFDKDPGANVPAGSFANALQLAKNNGLRAAWSNEAFEYWLLLHFNAYQGEDMNRNQYDEALEKWLRPLNATYAGTKDKLITTQLFALLQSRQAVAIQRAQHIFEEKEAHEFIPSIPASCTAMFLLVQRLLEIEAGGEI
jgi:hypothetical protein